MQRHFFRCGDCLQAVAVECEKVPQVLKCAGCDAKLDYLGRVTSTRSRLVRDQQVSACDERCTDAPGPKCSCSCGGENHGTGLTMTITVDAGNVPRVRPVNPEKSAKIAAEYREAFNAAHEAWKARYGDVWARKQAGWIPDFSHWLDARDALRTLNAAGNTLVASLRLKKLAAFTASMREPQPA